MDKNRYFRNMCLFVAQLDRGHNPKTVTIRLQLNRKASDRLISPIKTDINIYLRPSNQSCLTPPLGDFRILSENYVRILYYQVTVLGLLSLSRSVCVICGQLIDWWVPHVCRDLFLLLVILLCTGLYIIHHYGAESDRCENDRDIA